MISISEAIVKMVSGCCGSQHDICHFLKVWGYAKTIGELEGLDPETQQTLEFAAIVHDIACPDLRKEYGNAPWNMQETYGPPLVREFFKDSGMEEKLLSRICYLVGHHHTTADVDGLDYQILLEADFLVNAGEQEKYRKNTAVFREKVFKTKTGIRLLEEMFPAEEQER
jgi:hypothetical protein